MVFERIKFLASDVAPKPEETTYWVDIWSNPYGGVIKYYNGEDWVKLDQLTVAEDYRRLRFKPTLNGVTIEDDKTSIDYKIPSKEELDNVLNDFEQELNVIVNKTNQVITDLNQHITTADADFTKIKADITNIKESLQLIIGPSASQVIDKFNELISFLEGYNDDAKLKTILTALENKLTTLIQNIETDVDLQKKEIMAALNEHKNNTANPHNVTKAQIGLSNVDNTSDLNKPISNATQQAITNEATIRANRDKELDASITVNTNNISTLKSKVDTIQSTVNQFDSKYIPLSQKGTANGVASLNENGLVPTNMLPAFTDEVVDCFATFTKNEDGSLSDIHLYEDEGHQREIQGEASKIYIDITVRTLYNRATNNNSSPSEITNEVLNEYQEQNAQLFSNITREIREQTVFGNYQFRWTGTQFAVINASTVIGEITGTAYDGGKGKSLENKINTINSDINTAGSFRKADNDLKNTLTGNINTLQTTLTNKIATDINSAKTEIKNGNVATATKLRTPVKLWGNSFDGTADINGDINVHHLSTDTFNVEGDATFLGNISVDYSIQTESIKALTFISNDSQATNEHILLAKGGLKPLSELASAASLNNYLPLTGGTITGNIYKNSGEFVIGTKNEGNICLSYGNGLKQVYLTSVDFRPAVASNGKIDLGSSEAKWKNLYLSGNAQAALGFYEQSDIRLKTNIKPIDVKDNIELVEFDWKESGKHSYGVIAQQIEKDYPELVDSTGEYKTVKYDSVLIVKCAQLEERINKLEKELEELKNGKDSNRS